MRVGWSFNLTRVPLEATGERWLWCLVSFWRSISSARASLVTWSWLGRIFSGPRRLRTVFQALSWTALFVLFLHLIKELLFWKMLVGWSFLCGFKPTGVFVLFFSNWKKAAVNFASMSFNISAPAAALLLLCFRSSSLAFTAMLLLYQKHLWNGRRKFNCQGQEISWTIWHYEKNLQMDFANQDI